jgi:ferric-dicitrate binding protein FerR (iron transport regulator)
MDKVQARLIAEKFASGNYSEAEHEAFFQWLLSLPLTESRPLVEEYGGIFEALPMVPARRALWEKIYQRLDEQDGAAQEEHPAKGRLPVLAKSRRTWMFAAAAAILVTIGVRTFLWLKYPIKNTGTVSFNEFKNDVPPGGNKAILILSNGINITLDSAAKGNLANQGGVKVTKVDAGRLSYTGNLASGSDVLYNVVSTPSGGQYEITLADGTRVWLNALSTLRFPTAFSGHERSVQLTGEAYFEVSKDKKKPFQVNANGIDVEVLGTHFNVNAYADEPSVKTTLLEGSVRLVKGDKNMELKPGEQAQTTGVDGFFLDKDADTDQAVAWKNGHFSFDGSDVYEVMRQISRWYGVEVHYEGLVPHKSFDGNIGRDLNLIQVLTGLSKGGIHFRLEGTRLTVLP